MDKKLAIRVQSNALSAIKILHSTLSSNVDWNAEELKPLKRGIGLSIGAIEVDLLSVVYKEFPELDDLK